MASQILHLPTQQRLKDLLCYDTMSGVFTWATSTGPRSQAGSVAGWIASRGYRKITVDGCSYFAHRLAWMYVHGKDPEDLVIDHKDGDPANNAMDNLHIVSQKQNTENRKLQSNNTSGYPGVYWHNKASKWYARIKHNDKHISLGMFADPYLAHLAVEEARKELFTNSHGRHVV